MKLQFPKLRLLLSTVIVSSAAAAALAAAYNVTSSDFIKVYLGPGGTYHDVQFFSAVNTAVANDGAVQTNPCNGASITVSSGFGTNAAVQDTGANCAFQITSGTTAASNGVIGLPVNAAHGWSCYVTDQTTTSNAIQISKETTSTNNTATLDGFQNNSAAGNWVANDILVGQCVPY